MSAKKIETKIAREVYTKQKLDERTEKEDIGPNNMVQATKSDLNGT